MSALHSSGSHTPVWQARDSLTADSVEPAYPALSGNIQTDVLIVGAGIAGLSIAYELLTTKMVSVMVVEDGSRFISHTIGTTYAEVNRHSEIGSGETGRTTGHLSADNNYNDILVSCCHTRT